MAILRTPEIPEVVPDPNDDVWWALERIGQILEPGRRKSISLGIGPGGLPDTEVPDDTDIPLAAVLPVARLAEADYWRRTYYPPDRVSVTVGKLTVDDGQYVGGEPRAWGRNSVYPNEVVYRAASQAPVEFARPTNSTTRRLLGTLPPIDWLVQGLFEHGRARIDKPDDTGGKLVAHDNRSIWRMPSYAPEGRAFLTIAMHSSELVYGSLNPLRNPGLHRASRRPQEVC